jgi:hypothetical protein
LLCYSNYINNAPENSMLYEHIATYTTQTEADIFVRCCPKLSTSYRVGPGQYQVWVAL